MSRPPGQSRILAIVQAMSECSGGGRPTHGRRAKSGDPGWSQADDLSLPGVGLEQSLHLGDYPGFLEGKDFRRRDVIVHRFVNNEISQFGNGGGVRPKVEVHGLLKGEEAVMPDLADGSVGVHGVFMSLTWDGHGEQDLAVSMDLN